MAYDYFSQDQEELEKQQKEGAPQQLGQESPTIQSGQPTQQPGQGARSGSFTNLQSYLDANAGRKFGQEVAGRVQSQVDEATGAQGAAESGFKQKVDQSTVQKDESLLNKASSDPRGVAGNQEELNKFSQMRDAQYQGPQNLVETEELYTPASTKTQKAKSAADLTETEGGRKSYLDQQYGSGAGRYDYTEGQKKLDSFLINNDSGSRQAFENTRASAQSATDRFNDLKNSLSQYAQSGQQKTADARAAARGTVGLDEAGNYLDSAPVKQLYGTINQRANDLGQQKRSEYDSIRNALNALALNDPEFAKTGLQAGSRTAGLDLSQYWSAAGDPTVSGVTSADEAATLDALSSLAGKENSFVADRSQVGSYDPSKANSFDVNRFTNDVNASIAENTPKLEARDRATGIADLAQGKINTALSDPDLKFLLTAQPHTIAAKQYVQDVAASMGIPPNQIPSSNLINWLQGVVSNQRSVAQQNSASLPANFLATIGRR